MILFARCEPNPEGRCRSDVSFRVPRPDGSIYAEHRGAPLWNDVPPPLTSLQLAQGYLGFEVELDDPLGRYQIQAVVMDRVSGRQISLTRELRVLDVTSR